MTPPAPAPITERPILFSGEMVRAILAGRKTQTRRLMKPQPEVGPGGHVGLRDRALVFWALDSGESSWFVRSRCPFGGVGDRLWVRETWSRAQFEDRGKLETRTVYRADFPEDYDGFGIGRWYPSIHMKRADSRLLLEVTGARVERLQDITAADAVAEGAQRFEAGSLAPSRLGGSGAGWSMRSPANHGQLLGSPQMAFANLWNALNGADAWDANPWVWVVSFQRVDGKAVAA